MTDFPYALAICLGFPLALVTTVVLLRMRAHDRKAERKLKGHWRKIHALSQREMIIAQQARAKAHNQSLRQKEDTHE